MRSILRRFVPAVLLLSAAPAFADWCPLGPDGGSILALAVDPRDSRVVYAGTELSGRLYKTVDGGETWRLTGQGLPVDGYMLALAVDPRRRATVWAATVRDGVYKSTDAGASWSPSLRRRAGFEGYTFDLAVDPRTPDTVYAATAAGIFKTLNGGVRWRLKNRGLARQSIQVVEVDPGRPSVVYAADDLNGLYRTLNGGETWTPAGLELPEQETVTRLAATSGAVYAGTSKGRLFKSTDRGTTWFPASDRLPQEHAVASIAIHPRTPRIVYIGLANHSPSETPALYRSGNGGASWTPVVTGLTSDAIWQLAFGSPDSGLPGAPLYATAGLGTSPGGVFRSDDGRTWRSMVEGLAATWVRDVAAEPGDPGVLWSLLLTPGLFRSGDGGSSWTQLDLGEDVFSVEFLTADPRFPGTLYAMALMAPGNPSGISLFKTTDSGGSWTRFDLPTAGDLKLDPQTGVLFLLRDGALYRSADGGATWSQSTVGSVSDVAFPDSPSSVVFAAGAQVFKSVDGGVTWTRSDAGLGEVERITRIVAVPGAPSTLVATDGTSMLRSTDDGATWRKTFAAAAENAIESLLAAPDGTLYSYIFRQGLFISHDGVTWTPFAPGLPPGGRINRLILDPDDPETLYAASTDSVQAFRPGACSNDAF